MADKIDKVDTKMVDKIQPNDSRVKSQWAEVSGHKWHYLDAAPKGEPKGTIFLVHGFPDLSLAWRYQIPMLNDLGFRCIAIDCMGYGGTGTSSKLEDFGFKSHADAVAGIAEKLGVNKIIIGGHDWGGLTVYRVAQWYPNLVTHVFSVCTAYSAPSDQWISHDQLVQKVPQFGYQLQFGSPDHKVEKVVKDDTTVRKFLQGAFGGKPKSGKRFMTPQDGVDLDLVENDEFEMTPLMNEQELNYYVSEYMKNGINGPCNWYRTRRVNFDDETKMPTDVKRVIKQPTLFIQALSDNILTPELSNGMEQSIPNLTRGEVPASHWALWQTPAETNAIIKRWIEGVVLDGKSKL